MTKSVKIALSRVIAVLLGISMLASFGCQSGREAMTIDDYPIANPGVTEESDDSEAEEDDVIIKDSGISSEVNSLRENGKYSFDPNIIPDYFLNKYKDDPDIIRMAKKIINAIYNGEPGFSFDEAVDDDTFNRAWNIAKVSNPLADAVNIVKEGENEYTFEYFPECVIVCNEETGDIYPICDEAVDATQAKKYIDEFVGYVTDTINNNLTSKSTDKEIAEILYSQLIKDMKFSLDRSHYNDPLTVRTYSEYDIGETEYRYGDLILGVNERNITDEQYLVRLYSFMLTQLHINVREIYGFGGWEQEYLDYINSDDYTVGSFTVDWLWNKVEIDGVYYNCDIVMEKLIYDSNYGDSDGYFDPDMFFFGMSDATRKEFFYTESTEVFMISTDKVEMVIQSDIPTEVPECPNDLYEN